MSKPVNVNIRNKKASHDYEFILEYVAGIQLTGTEIKSLREGKASLTDAFCFFQNDELWAKNIHISEYSFGSYANHAPKRDRKLLLKRQEIYRLQQKLKEKGLTIIIKSIFINERGWAKVGIALARGKKEFDKREDLKEKDAKREMDKAKKHY